MPKIKTKSAAAKRFKVSKGGKIVAKFAYKSHFLRRRSQDMKRNARGRKVLAICDQKLVKKYFRG